MRKLLATSLICLAVSGTAADAQAPAALNVAKQAASVSRIIRPSPALTHEIVNASRFSTALLRPEVQLAESLFRKTDPRTLVNMLNANSFAHTLPFAERAVAPALPALAAATKEALVTVSILDQKFKVGELARFGRVVVKGGDIDISKVLAAGAVAAVAYCNFIGCSDPIPTAEELNKPEVAETDD